MSTTTRSELDDQDITELLRLVAMEIIYEQNQVEIGMGRPTTKLVSLVALEEKLEQMRGGN